MNQNAGKKIDWPIIPSYSSEIKRSGLNFEMFHSTAFREIRMNHGTPSNN